MTTTATTATATTATATTATAATAAATVGGFVAPLTRKGAVTVAASRATAALNLASEAALRGIALTGNGTAKKAAIAHITAGAVTVERLLVKPLTGDARIDGRALADMLALLAGMYPAAFTAGLRGAPGILAVLATAEKMADTAVDLSMDKSAKAQTRAIEALARVRAHVDTVGEWLDAGAVAAANLRATTTEALESTPA